MSKALEENDYVLKFLDVINSEVHFIFRNKTWLESIILHFASSQYYIHVISARGSIFSWID